MKKLKTIKLRITQCTVNEAYGKCWYSDKIGKKLYFFNRSFKDDGDKIDSLYKAKMPINHYVYMRDTNYDNYIRKQKLKKLNKNANKI